MKRYYFLTQSRCDYMPVMMYSDNYRFKKDIRGFKGEYFRVDDRFVFTEEEFLKQEFLPRVAYRFEDMLDGGYDALLVERRKRRERMRKMFEGHIAK